MNLVILSTEFIEPYKLLEKFQHSNCDLSISGAQSVFIGYMRETNHNRKDIVSMKLDYYPEMTKKYLEDLSDSIKKEYKLHNVLIAHRVGKVFPNDCLVIVACWSKHRKTSIDAVKIILEDLKHKAPLWKKEYFSDETSLWVESNT